jgi:hypothetical protein
MEFSKILVATDIKEFSSKDIRNLTVEFIYKFFPKGEITLQELATFFKLPFKPETQRAPSRERNNSTSDNIKPRPPPPNQDWLDPYSKPAKKEHHKIPIFPEKPKEQPNFGKKTEYPEFLPVEIDKPNRPEMEMRFSNCDNVYPLSMRYYNQGEPEPSEYQVLEELEDLLRNNRIYSDSSNPKIHDGAYTPAKDIFQSRYYIFQMAASVLMREKSRIGIAQ